MKPAADDTVGQLFNAHGRALLLYARQWLETDLAEDVVQRVFLKLLDGRTMPAEPRTWLFRCVRNEAISAWRSARRRGKREHTVSQASAAWFVPHLEDRIDARAAQEALASLPDEVREIVALRIWSGLTLAQIAEVTGRGVSTVHDQYRAALAALRARLESPCRNKNR